MEIGRLSINQITLNRIDTKQFAQSCAQEGINSVALWRHKVQETGVSESAKLMREYGLSVSSLCRGGMFPAVTEVERMANLDDNRRAIDEAATIGTDVLVLVCGGMQGQSLEEARMSVLDGIEALLPYAIDVGVKLAIEPLHPMFAADRSVVVSLKQANDMIETLGHGVGIIVDVYHVWWDPQLYDEIARASGHILGFHVNDWVLPIRDTLTSRGMMGDGVIDLRGITRAVEAAGFNEAIEVEILNERIWDTTALEVIPLIKKRFDANV